MLGNAVLRDRWNTRLWGCRIVLASPVPRKPLLPPGLPDAHVSAFAKRLFGLRGGREAFEEERHSASLIEVEESAGLTAD